MGIVTDSKGVNEPKDPEQNVIYLLYRLVATSEECAEMEKGFRLGGMGYGDAKKRLAAKLEEVFGGGVRERRWKLDQEPERVEEALVSGALRARKMASATLEQVYEAVGIPSSRVKKGMLDLGL